MKTITVSQTTPEFLPPKTDTRPPARDFYQARSAVVVGSFLFTGFVGVGFLSLYAIPIFVSWPLGLIPVGLFLAFSIASLLGIVWTSWDVAGGWILDFIGWHKSRKDTQPEESPVLPPVELNKGERIAYAARLILEMQYIEQIPTTRAECEKAGISQPLWNRANEIFQALGIKTGNDWKMDYLGAMRSLMSIRIEENGSVWLPNGTGMKRI